MGSRSSDHTAYIAGFLDGDGSIMLQVKKRSDSSRALRFMATICLYQDSRHEHELRWMKQMLGVGYMSKRNDGMSELRIQGYKAVHDVLVLLEPFIRFKRVQAKALMQACEMLMTVSLKKMTTAQLKKLVEFILLVQEANYATKKKRSKKELYEVLGLTP